jgi:hypothetical protein
MWNIFKTKLWAVVWPPSMGASTSKPSEGPTTAFCSGLLCFPNDDALGTQRKQGQSLQLCCSRSTLIRKPEKSLDARAGTPQYNFEERNLRSRKEIPDFLSDLFERADSKGNTRASTERSLPETTESSFKNTVPVWKKEPEPLQNWTVEEQKVVLSEMKRIPQVRKYPEQLQIVFEKSLRKLPNKSLRDIQVCYEHLKISRIAYFGSESGRTSRHTNVQHTRPKP